MKRKFNSDGQQLHQYIKPNSSVHVVTDKGNYEIFSIWSYDKTI